MKVGFGAAGQSVTFWWHRSTSEHIHVFF